MGAYLLITVSALRHRIVARYRPWAPHGARRAPAGGPAAGVALLALLAAGALAGCGRAASLPTELEAFVQAPTPEFAFEGVSSRDLGDVQVHVLRLTSQRWLTQAEVDRTLWWHWLTVVEPPAVTNRQAILFLASGDNHDPPPEAPSAFLRQAAVASGSIVAELRQVPNQPLTFAGDGRPREEDALIAYAWDRFLRGGDAAWLPRLPMTRAAVRAMDAVEAFCAGRGHPVERFVVAGRSKRGWTAWTTALADPRVAGVVPMVIDLLNVDASFQHHRRVYGDWSPAIHDYVEAGIPDWLGTGRFQELRRVVDPYEHRDRLTLPKLIINAAGDEFFLPDGSRFYFGELKGEKHLRCIPNTGHSLGATDADLTLLAFHQALAAGTPRPRFTWRFTGEDAMEVHLQRGTPAAGKLWQAHNPRARDFRISTIGRAWRETPLTPDARGRYTARVAVPESGHTAFFVELTFALGAGPPLILTTEVRVVPDTYPQASPAPGSAAAAGTPGAP